MTQLRGRKIGHGVRLLPRCVTLVAIGAASMSLGCLGRIGEAGNRGRGSVDLNGTPATTTGSSTDPTGTCSDAQLSAATVGIRIRRLTKLEVRNTVADLFTDAVAAHTDAIEPDPRPQGYSTGDERSVNPSYMDTLSRTVQQVAADFRKTVGKTTFAADCFAADAAARDCASKFIREFGKKAYRRALEDSEVTALLSVFDAGRATGIDADVTDRLGAGIEYTVRAALMSPSFVFRTELGAATPSPGSSLRLASYELASAISYGVVASPPDAALVSAAESDQLATPDQIAAEVRRLIGARPDRFQAIVRQFLLEWLGIDFDKPDWNSKDPKLYPGFSAATKAALQQETTLFLDDWTSSGPNLPALLTSPSTFINQANAPVYGLVSGPASFQKQALDPKQRAGILTSPGFLGTYAHTDSSSPVLRGVAIMRHLLCREPPPVPAMVPPLPAIDQSAVKTTRQRFDKHTSIPFCHSCHRVIDPMGDVFESYDAVGAYRTVENGVPIDSSGGIAGTPASDALFGNAIDMVNALATSPDVHECFVRQVYRSTVGRTETDADHCSIQSYTTTFANKGLDLRELLVAVTASPAFALRAAPVGP
jgi:Protein of unknown function (DUF1588)/Protein of unknown function (DUF1592)/Protein of unknown function (DUF1595)/Protein of unknown function (DUF1585)/Protein of unknown function (DUF1587)